MFQRKDGDPFLALYNTDGTYSMSREAPWLDIVSEWQEPINEEKLDKLSDEYANNNHRCYACHDDDTDDWYTVTDKRTAKEATLAAIDVTLEYLKENRK